MTTSTDRVMQTVTRYFEVSAEDTDRTRKVEDAARRASADPGFRDALTRILEADWTQGSFSACTQVRSGDTEIDAITRLPGSTMHCALQVKVRDAAGPDPWVCSQLAWLLAAAIYVDRSSLGTADAWSLRSQPTPGDIATVRETWRRLLAADVTFSALPTVGDRQEPDGHDPAPDPVCASTAAEFAAQLAQLRLRAGEPSFREMARRARPTLAPSSLASALHAERLPTLRVVSAFITGCGGGPEEVQRFAAAWRRLRADGSSYGTRRSGSR